MQIDGRGINAFTDGNGKMGTGRKERADVRADRGRCEEKSEEWAERVAVNQKKRGVGMEGER